MHPPLSPAHDTVAARLLAQRAALASQLRRSLAHLPSALTAQLLSDAVTLHDREVARQLRGRDLAQLAGELDALHALDAACARLAAGTYGRCLNCGKPIALKRLRAQPAALKCLPCQEIHELQPHRWGGDD